VRIHIPNEDLAYFDTARGAWVVEGGDYEVHVGASSRDLRGTAGVSLAGDAGPAILSAESTIGEWLKHPVGGQILAGALAQSGDAGMGAMLADPALMRMIESMPLNRVAAFPGSPVTAEQLGQLVVAANGAAVPA
jgi:beta-glucosidase